MNAFPPLRRFWIVLFLVSHFAGWAEDAPPIDAAKLRAAITKSLGFLVREGDAWMNEKDCNGCHHVPELLWGLREAKRRGIPVDEAKYTEFLTWSDEHATKSKAGLEALALLMLAMPELVKPEWSKLLAEQQLTDGSWKPSGQFAGMQKREIQEATKNSVRLFLLALAPAPSGKAARAKAVAAFAKSEPEKSLETLIFRALYAQRFGSAEEAAASREEIRKLQHPDGGWAWMIGEEQSDPLATGEALYLLQQAPEPASAVAIGNAQHWLLQSQREDGSWLIDPTKISRVDRSGPAKAKSLKDVTAIYTYWSSAWATIGLLQGLPLAEP